ncbi:MAG: type VI secretion protein ImpB [Maricaulaceae bacterium]
MRKADSIEWLYLDFDGFFASVEQQARPALRGKPIGIVPFDGTVHTVVIACSKEAKARGVKNVMRLVDARKVCPELVLVPQTPDLYRRAHNALLAEINSVIPVSAIKSIDELTCKLDPKDIDDPHRLATDIKRAIAEGVGSYITCSIGFAPNRHLAKIACKMDKPNGVTIWSPDDIPAVMYSLPFDDIPGIGSGMEKRLHRAGIYNMKALLSTAPKQMRKIWNNVTGERLWYALHGYEIQAGSSERGMFGHGRVLPPESRSYKEAYDCTRILIVKAARRMRREGFYASTAFLWLHLRFPNRKERGWGTRIKLHMANDDQACLKALKSLWRDARREVPSYVRIIRVHVTLGDLTRSDSRQLDMLLNDDPERQKWEAITTAMDGLNSRYGKSLVTMGLWKLPAGGNLGGKISFTRIPRAEDFW